MNCGALVLALFCLMLFSHDLNEWFCSHSCLRTKTAGPIDGKLEPSKVWQYTFFFCINLLSLIFCYGNGNLINIMFLKNNLQDPWTNIIFYKILTSNIPIIFITNIIFLSSPSKFWLHDWHQQWHIWLGCPEIQRKQVFAWVINFL